MTEWESWSTENSTTFLNLAFQSNCICTHKNLSKNVLQVKLSGTLRYILLINMEKQNLTLNDKHKLICHKTQTKQIKLNTPQINLPVVSNPLHNNKTWALHRNKNDGEVSSSGALGTVEYPFIVINRRSALTQSVNNFNGLIYESNRSEKRLFLLDTNTCLFCLVLRHINHSRLFNA